jgi:hypothetical protein
MLFLSFTSLYACLHSKNGKNGKNITYVVYVRSNITCVVRVVFVSFFLVSYSLKLKEAVIFNESFCYFLWTA